MSSSDTTATRRIAVIGMAGRFPGADSVDELWSNLSSGIESIRRFSREEMLAEGVSPELLADPAYVPAGGALSAPDRFAATFFGYSPREALIMDPQQRLFLECSWEALEAAGYGRPAEHNPIGVFAAVSLNTYLLNRLVHRPDLLEALVDIETTIGNDKDFLASRVAYKLDLRGPTAVVQSACSSSLLAIHLARQAILTGDCEMALAGGSSVDVPQRAGYLYTQEGIYSSDGHCRPFDARADGMVGGSGTGVVVLKRLDRALTDGDTVHAVLCGSAVNNDGANKVGYSAPSVEAQAAVVASAHRTAEVDSATIGYVEAHGTATALGDPIEIEALSEAFEPFAPRSCVLGAVKSNLGHLNAAAGVTGFIKATLAVRNGKIPPTLHFETPNPHIDLDRTPFWINTRTIEWPDGDGPRRAGVSSFGMGGTNVHAVLEEAPVRPENAAESGPCVLPLSARTESALLAARQRLGDHLDGHPEIALSDVAHTLQVGRKNFSQRSAIVADSRQQAIEALRSGDRGSTGMASTSEPAVAFLFPGQGAQYPGMAAALADEFPSLADRISDGCRHLGGSLGDDLARLLLDEPAPGAADRLAETELAQPALFLIEYALARLLEDLGVAPSVMLGHSIGEYTAACVAGVFSFDDGVALVRERGRAMQSMPPGAMLAVALAEPEIRDRLVGGAVVAALNEPTSSVVSGTHEEIEGLERRLAADEIATQRLKTSHAFHSPLMRGAAEALGEVFSKIELSAPETPFVSNVSGTWITPEEATDPSYWSRHLLAPVRFSDGLRNVLESGAGALVELGPGRTLTALADHHPARRSAQRATPTMAHPKSSTKSAKPFFEAVGTLWASGASIEWRRFEGAGRRRVPLPTYPFERQSFWVDPPTEPIAGARPAETRLGEVAWCHLPSWQRIATPRTPSPPEAPLVVLRPASAEGEALARQLASVAPIVEVVPGTSFDREGTQRYRLDPRSPEHHTRLAESLGSRRLNVVHLWGLADDTGAGDPGSSEIEAGDRAAAARTRSRSGDWDRAEPRRGLDSLLALAQGLHPAVESLDLVAVSATSQEVTGGEAIDPWQALIVGPCRVIPFERHGWRSRVVDFERAPSTRGGAELPADTAGRLLGELAANDDERLIAYRGRHRWKPASTPFAPPLAAADPSPLEGGGACLIAGGLGGIGTALAEALFERYRARLVLLGRSGRPGDDPARDNRESAAAERLRRLEALGAEIEVVAADIASRGELEEAARIVEKRFGPLDLVVHAAGEPGGRALDRLSPEDVDGGLAAKVEGTTNLYEVFCRDSEARLVLCSSLASEIGGFGQLDYCAANAFQDAFAISHGAGGGVLAIDWETWSERGMAVDTEVPPELEEARREALRFGLTDDEGKRLFLRLLDQREARVLVSTRPLAARLEAERQIPTAEEETVQPASPEAGAERPDLSTRFVGPRTEIEERLAEIWQPLFGVDRIGVDDDFFELGGHSLLATQMLNRLRKVYPEARLGLATLFDAPTIAQLATEIGAAGRAAGQALDRETLLALDRAERTERLRVYFETRLGQRESLDAGDLDGRELAPEIVWDLRRDLDLIVYPHELEGVTTLDDLAETVAGLVVGIAPQTGRESEGEPPAERATAAPAPADHRPEARKTEARKTGVRQAEPGRKNPSMIFLLSAPRSGSTLLRLMLAGHSRLFCPPELALLSAGSLEEWKSQQHGIFARDGLTRALIELESLEPEEALRQIAAAVEADLGVGRLYARLQEACGERILVDKSPAYALHPSALERAERLFDAPRYVILTRHPVAVIESLVRHRMEALLADGPVDDAWRFAESIWRRTNTNLVQLEETVGTRAHRVRYEDLVGSPEKVMRQVAGFLQLEFEAALLEPYSGGRMIDGPGDPDIFQHDRIEAGLADAWRRIDLPIELAADTVDLATALGYESIGDMPSASAGDEGSPPPADDDLAPEEADRLLSRLDELSDDEVEATLTSLLGEDDGVRE